MKKYILLLFVFIACGKDRITPTQPAPATACTINASLFKDVAWHMVDSPLTLRFNSTSEYFENDSLKGSWDLEDHCSVVFVSRTSTLHYQFKILNVTADSLRVQNISGGTKPYYNYYR